MDMAVRKGLFAMHPSRQMTLEAPSWQILTADSCSDKTWTKHEPVIVPAPVQEINPLRSYRAIIVLETSMALTSLTTPFMPVMAMMPSDNLTQILDSLLCSCLRFCVHHSNSLESYDTDLP
eukprot:4856190-Amphidinium_carterae.2